MKIEEGMYARTKKGKIYKFKSNNSMARVPYMINCSYNIIDLIQVGDYVNGMRIVAKDSDNRLYVAEDLGQPYDREFYNGCFEYTILDERFKIKTILTKEQYENNSYKVEV